MDSSIKLDSVMATRNVNQARAMFQRVLVCWAGDVLELRRRKLLVPQWEASPGSMDSQAFDAIEPMKRVA